MKTKHVAKILGLTLSVCLVLAGWGLAAKTTIIGTVNDNYQIVADDAIYDIVDTEKGNELAEDHVGARVEVDGEVETVDDSKIIVVVSYHVLSD